MDTIDVQGVAFQRATRLQPSPPTMTQNPDYIEISLKNGGWDGTRVHTYSESDAHAVATRVVNLAKELVLADAGLVFRSGHMMAVVQRETQQFRFMGTWIDFRFGNRQGVPIIMADDERNQIGEWAFGVARVQLHSMQLERQVNQMSKESEERAKIKAQIEEANEQGAGYTVPPIPGPPPGMSAMQFMQASGRLDPAWIPIAPSAEQVAATPRSFPVGVF